MKGKTVEREKSTSKKGKKEGNAKTEEGRKEKR